MNNQVHKDVSFSYILHIHGLYTFQEIACMETIETKIVVTNVIITNLGFK